MNGFGEFLYITYIFRHSFNIFSFIGILSNYIGHKSSFNWTYLYNFYVYKKYKVNDFLILFYL